MRTRFGMVEKESDGEAMRAASLRAASLRAASLRAASWVIDDLKPHLTQ